MLEGIQPRVTEGLCAVMSRAIEQLDDKDVAILVEALKDNRWSHTYLTEVLNERGFLVGSTLIRNHRLNKCRCAR